MKSKPKEQAKEKVLPEAKFKSGALQATIWKNESEKDGEKFENFSFTIERTYLDDAKTKEAKENVYGKTNSFRKRDVANVQALIAKVSEYLYIDEDEEKDKE